MLSNMPLAIPSPSTGRFDPPPFVEPSTTEPTAPVKQQQQPKVSPRRLAAAVLDPREKERWLGAIEQRMKGKADDTTLDLDDIHFRLAGGNENNKREVTAQQFLQELWPHMNAQNAPKTVAEARNLVNWLRHPLPSSPALGNYCGLLLRGGSPGSPGLQLPERKQLIAAFARDVGGAILNSMKPRAANMDDQINEHLDSHAPLNRFRQQALLAAIGRSESGFTKAQRNQLLLMAQMLYIDPELGLRRNHIAGYDLYSPANAARTLASVREELKEHLERNKGVRPEAADATVHIMLASVAPEFLVRGIPDTLHIGSPAWLAFRKTVALIEESAPGSCRVLTYEQVIERTALQPLTPEQTQLFHAAETEPLLDWAVMHGVIAARADDQYTVEDLQKAVEKYNLYIEATHQAAIILSTPVAGRRALAEADLRQVFPGRNVNKPVHFVENLLLLAPTHDVGYQQTLVDLHMMGVLKDGKFDVLRQNDSWFSAQYKSEFTPELASLKTQFKKLKYSRKMLDQTAKDNATRFHSAVSTGLKDILSKMPYADRHALETQTLTFYQVQAEMADGNGVHGRSTQEQLDAVQGRYGFLIRAGEGKDAKCFEFFPMSGTYVERPEFIAALDNGEAEIPNVWNIRMKSHVDGSSAGASEIQVKALRSKLPAARGAITTSFPLGFFSPRAEAIAQYVAQRNLVLRLDDLQTEAVGSTPREDFDNRVKQAVNSLIPFKACYDDIVSGRVKQDLGALAGCATDAVAAISIIGGGVVEGVAAISRAEAGLSRLAAATRAVGNITNGLFNPVAGLSEPLHNAYKWLKDKSVLRLRGGQGPLRDAWRAQLDEQRAVRYRQMRRDSLKETPTVGKGEASANKTVSKDEAVASEAAGKDEAAATRVVPEDRVTVDEVRKVMEGAQPQVISKINNAFAAMADPALAEDVDFVLKHLQGKSPARAREWMELRMSSIKAKAEALTSENINIVNTKGTGLIASVDLEKYAENPSGEFIEISAQGAKSYYQRIGAPEEAMGNALIHELDHLPGEKTDGIYDFAYLTETENDNENAAGLLNLAKGHTSPEALVKAGEDAPMLIGRSGAVMYGSRAGSLNAESTMTSVALLAQLKTNPELFQKNRKVIEDALKKFGALPVNESVPIKIVNKRSVSTPVPRLIYMFDRRSKRLLGAYRLMQQPPGTTDLKQPPTQQTVRNQTFNNYVQEHLVF